VSLTHRDDIVCVCGGRISVYLADSLNAGRHPHLRQAVLDRRLHAFACSLCQATVTVEKELLYFDFGRRHFLGVFPRDDRARERACGEALLQAFDAAVRQNAPAAIAAEADRFLVRACFGYEELREKLVIAGAGLSDLILEALKCEILLADPWFADSGVITLRLDAVREDGALLFLPERADGIRTDHDLRVVALERARYDRLAERSVEELWRERRDLAAGPHVSLLRLVPWPGRPPAPERQRSLL
jgi:hypothetical protein